MTNQRKIALLLGIILVLIITYLVWGLNARNWDYALPRRIPKVVAIMVVSAAIGASTMVFQTITNNRILTPSLMGLDSLYLLVQTVLLFVLGPQNKLVLHANWNFAFVVGSMIVFSLVLYRVVFSRVGQDIFFFLLVGLILGTLFQSATSFLQMVMDPNEFSLVQNKMFASFNNINTSVLALSTAVLVLALVYIYRHSALLDVVALGREHSINLGVAYDQVVRNMLMTVAVLISVATVLVGPLTFLGLLIANLARELMRTYKHHYLILTSALLGVVVLMGSQLLVERLLNFAVPVSVLINLLGGVYFMFLLWRNLT